MDRTEAADRLLVAAEELFYRRGIQAVGMDEIRSRSGVSLKRLYQCFPSKEELVVAYLRHRDDRWRAALVESVTRCDPPDRLLAVFDWLGGWFAEPDFRGCAFINSFGEFGDNAPAVADTVRHHRHELTRYLAALVEEANLGDRRTLTAQLQLLIDGAITAAAINGDPNAARNARDAAKTLLDAARRRP
ncbi:TetR/AcrR family transcriptional regulator [Nocardia panacis]|uniref:TetR/AcrR family transcriptional regulator n=1 Tax=Nocardia panacis TaxID=2340916 RepID=A0A3A4K0J0_9NOCA|nr:TetR/AcrR family transcriptional regulator [Nocardia panacis]RJO70783.1 TetR/AcrR family transcriptional regulator [Nocardia panacis]